MASPPGHPSLVQILPESRKRPAAVQAAPPAGQVLRSYESCVARAPSNLPSPSLPHPTFPQTTPPPTLRSCRAKDMVCSRNLSKHIFQSIPLPNPEWHLTTFGEIVLRALCSLVSQLEELGHAPSCTPTQNLPAPLPASAPAFLTHTC